MSKLKLTLKLLKPPHFDLAALVAWLLFLSVYALVWNNGIGYMLDLAEPLLRTVPCKRYHLLLLGFYIACRATLIMALIMLLSFCVMTCVQCMLPFVSYIKPVYAVGTWLFSENVLMRPLSPSLLPFHAAVLVSSLVLATLYSVALASASDLEDSDRCRSVVVREALGMAMMGLAAYAALALFLTTNPSPPQTTLKKGTQSITAKE